MTLLNDRAKALIEGGRRQPPTPSAEQRARMKEAVLASVAVPVSAATTAGVAKPAALLSTTVGKVLVGVAAVVLIAGGAVAWKAQSVERAPIAAAAPVPAPSAPAPSGGLQLSEELRLLREAMAQTEAKNWTAALATLDGYQARFPRGELAVEADALRVLSLCGLDRTDDARALAGRLSQSAPNSPAVQRLKSSCAAP